METRIVTESEKVSETPERFVDHILWTFVEEKARTCGHWHYYYTAVGDFLVILNSSVNFVIYIVTNRNFRQGLMLMQTAGASISTRDACGLAGTGTATADRGRLGGVGVSTASPARIEFIGLRRQGVGVGSGNTSSGELTAAVSAPRRVTALTPIAEHNATTTLATRYFEPKILLQ